jgi:hypothetical protein
MNAYPKAIGFNGPRDLGSSTPGYRDVCRKVMDGMKMTMLHENILQVEYPAELVRQIRTVNVDDRIFRLDIVPSGHDTRLCLFPTVPWNTETFFRNGRFLKGRREETEGKLILVYPEL